MAVFRVEKTKDYTVMANYHLRDIHLSLKAKGMLSLMLSLPDDWDYTTKGLAKICRDGVDSICSTIKELEENGYVVRKRVRNDKGQLADLEYTILEKPIDSSEPQHEEPQPENPVVDNPNVDSPVLEKHAQLSTYVSSTEKELNIYESNPIVSNQETLEENDTKRNDITSYRDSYRKMIKDNIEYEYLIQDSHLDHECIDEMVDIMVDALCSTKSTLRISGNDFPVEVVKNQLLKLDSSHIQYVLDCLNENTTKVHNIKQYLLATLYNAPSTIGNYYSALVRHDMYGSFQT